MNTTLPTIKSHRHVAVCDHRCHHTCIEYHINNSLTLGDVNPFLSAVLRTGCTFGASRKCLWVSWVMCHAGKTTDWEVQREEVLALKSIYCGPGECTLLSPHTFAQLECSDQSGCRNDVHSFPVSLEFRLAVPIDQEVTSSNKAGQKITVTFQLSESYPEISPQIIVSSEHIHNSMSWCTSAKCTCLCMFPKTRALPFLCSWNAEGQCHGNGCKWSVLCCAEVTQLTEHSSSTREKLADLQRFTCQLPRESCRVSY